MMVEPDICQDCIENDHDNCRKKKSFATLRGVKCECFVCWGTLKNG